MRLRAGFLLGLVAATVASPVAVFSQQDTAQIDKRVGTLESQMRAVQRKVFPGGSPKYFEPEFQPAEPGQTAAAAPAATDPKVLAELQARLLELEKQLGELTGRVEQNENKTRQLEQAFKTFKADVEERLGKLEPSAAAVPVAVPTTAQATPVSGVKPVAVPVVAATPTGVSTPAADAQYKTAFAAFEAKEFDKAELGFKDFLSRYGYKNDSNKGHALAPNAQYWLGRTYVNKKLFAQAARTFLDGYQRFPKSDKAPDSLLGLGESLTALGKPQDACSAFNELKAVYPDARPEIKTKAEAGRIKAKCS
jgi:tol-pal system protein YbgF